MSVGTIQREARIAAGVTQQEFADEIHYSRSMVAEIEAGRKKISPEIAAKAVERLDDGFYSMEMAHELTGGAYVGKLDGDHVELGRCNVQMKSIEELRECSERLSKLCIVNRPNGCEMKQEELKAVLIECLDVIVCLSHFVAVICKEYAISWMGIWKLHRKKLKDRNYIK